MTSLNTRSWVFRNLYPRPGETRLSQSYGRPVRKKSRKGTAKRWNRNGHRNNPYKKG